MEQLLDGLAPGLPEELRGRILARAEGVPLYAVETIRMLLDRGLVERVGDHFRVTGDIPALDVPETLHGLVAARLDGLGTDERRLVQDASVLGKTFTKQALAALSGQPETEVEVLLQGLVRKEVLSIQADPRSPERGQYGFLQDLLRHVAYETLAKSDRKRRHLAAAAVLQDMFSSAEHEIAEVIASHYLEAYRAAPDTEDASEIKNTAREFLARAGDRAASLAANEEAQRYYEEAAELADDPLAEAELRERGGRMATMGGRNDAARAAYERALALFEQAGESHAAARASARLGEAEWIAGRLKQALERMEASFAVLVDEELDEDVALLAAELARLHFFEGDAALAAERIEVALEVAETLRLPELLSQALNTKSLILSSRRPEESRALLRHALDIALEHDLAAAALRAYFNLSYMALNRERWDEGTRYLESGLALARARGQRAVEWRTLGNLVDALQYAGEWDAALARAAELPDEARDVGAIALNIINPLTRIYTSRGDVAAARNLVDDPRASWAAATGTDVQRRGGYRLATAVVCRAEERYEEAIAAAEEAMSLHASQSNALAIMESFVEAVESALQLDRLDTARDLFAKVENLGPGLSSQSTDAQRRRLGAQLAVRLGEPDKAEHGFKRAAAAFRELAVPFWLGVTLLEHAEWLVAEARADEAEPLRSEAREIFERLGAAPYLGRCDRARAPELEPA